ncbi:hypothetical protein [Aeoliella sp.]|uniref:hypothetical protein n=1 Tax=Aeoliella sp. TaxID=2795800 RepID=UPI003CCC2787
MLAKVLLATWITTSAALAVSPWDDRTIEVDKEAKIAELKELYDAQRRMTRRTYELHLNGLIRSGDLSRGAADYFVAGSRLAWAEGEIQRSYRLAQLAANVREQFERAIGLAVERGLVSIDQLLVAQEQVAEAKLVLLRYEAVAKERGIQLESIEPFDHTEYLNLLREELDLPERPARIPPPRQPARPQGERQSTPGVNKP